jgi:nucleoid-associated protein YgaU
VPPPPSLTSNTYTVQKGDTLWSIAQKHLGDGKRWREIVELNPGLEPSKLKVGQVIILPAK